MLDAVAQANDLRTIFEPLHPFAIPEVRPYAYRYIPAECELPGLQNFHFVGAWATSAGALFANALSGRKLMQKVCRQDGKRFVART